MAERLSKAEQRFVDDMMRCRGIDFARLGMMVEVDGHLGTIKGMNRSANLDVEFVNQLKWGKGTHNCHPTWKTRYFDADGNVIEDYCKRAPSTNGTTSQPDDNEIDGDAAVAAHYGL